MSLVFSSSKKFASSSRLFFGSLATEVTEEDLRNALLSYGEVGEIQLTKRTDTNKCFAFVTMDYRQNAEKAKTHLDGTKIKGKEVIVKWAVSNSIIWVGDLNKNITDENLVSAFSEFGEIEDAVIATDQTTHASAGYGFVEFKKSTSAKRAVQTARDSMLLLAASPRPVRVEMARFDNLQDGFHETDVIKSGGKPIDVTARYAKPGTIEFEFAKKWRELTQRQEAEKHQLKLVHAEEHRLLFAAQAEHFKQEQEKLKWLEEMQKTLQAGGQMSFPPHHPHNHNLNHNLNHNHNHNHTPSTPSPSAQPVHPPPRQAPVPFGLPPPPPPPPSSLHFRNVPQPGLPPPPFAAPANPQPGWNSAVPPMPSHLMLGRGHAFPPPPHMNLPPPHHPPHVLGGPPRV